MLIKVFPSCCGGEKVVTLVEEAVRQSGVEAQVEIVKDLAATAKAGIIATPAVTVDGRPVASGRMPKAADLAKRLSAAAKTQS
jgi:hypothetical protein